MFPKPKRLPAWRSTAWKTCGLPLAVCGIWAREPCSSRADTWRAMPLTFSSPAPSGTNSRRRAWPRRTPTAPAAPTPPPSPRAWRWDCLWPPPWRAPSALSTKRFSPTQGSARVPDPSTITPAWNEPAPDGAPAADPGVRPTLLQSCVSETSSREAEFPSDARHVPHRGSTIRFHHPRLFLRHGLPLETHRPGQRPPSRPAGGARSGLRNRRFFAHGEAAIPRIARRRRGYHRAHAPTGARARRGAHGLRRCRHVALPGPLVRLRFRRLRPAQFPQSQRRRERDRARHPSRRLPRLPGFLPALQRSAAPSLPRLSLCARYLLGICSSWPAPRLHLHPRFASKLRFHRRFFSAASPLRLPPGGCPPLRARRHRPPL